MYHRNVVSNRIGYDGYHYLVNGQFRQASKMRIDKNQLIYLMFILVATEVSIDCQVDLEKLLNGMHYYSYIELKTSTLPTLQSRFPKK